MPGIVLPDWVARNHARRRIMEDQSSGLSQTRYWNPILEQIDHRLELVMVGRWDDHPGGVIPYRWHILRRNEAGPDSYWPIVGPNDSFREMGSDVIEDFKGRDLWNPTVRHEVETVRRRRAASEERAKETRKEARVGEIAMNIKAMDSPGVPFNDVRWSARSAGKRGRS